MRAPVRSSVERASDVGAGRVRRRSVVAVVLAVSLVLTACGAEQPAETAIATPPDSADSRGQVTNLFPDLDVVSVATGQSLNLKTELSGGDLPVLLWFWAPH